MPMPPASTKPAARFPDRGPSASSSRPPGRAAFAAMDLGTNSCRMLIATPAGAARPAHEFQVVGGFSRITRLGEGLSASGSLSPPAMERTIEALAECVALADRHRVRATRFVTTEACRRADNCETFTTRVAEEVGLRLETISPAEEARLALKGSAPLLDPERPDALLFDVGGGSTELIHARLGADGEPEIQSVLSLPFGVVTISEDRGGTVEADDFDAVRAQVRERLRPFEEANRLRPLIEQGRVQMLGTSGTVTTVAAAALDLTRYDRSRVDGLTLDQPTLDDAARKLVAMTNAQRAAHPCIGEGRADLVVAGCAILEAICETWPVGRLVVADRGLREGILTELIEADRNR